MVRIRNKRDFFAGLLLIGFGLSALLIASHYKMGTTFRMGPGYFPVVLSIFLVGIGVIVAAAALRSVEAAMPKMAWRPLLVVTVAVVLFGLVIKDAGLLLTTFVLVVASRLARQGYPRAETFVLGAAISVVCAAVFYFGLRVQMPLLPAWG